MKKALTYALLGGNIFFLLFFGLGLHNAIITVYDWFSSVEYDLLGECIEGFLLYGMGFVYLFPFIIPFMLIPFCLSILIKKRVSDKFAKVNRVVFLSFIAFYIILIMSIMSL